MEEKSVEYWLNLGFLEGIAPDDFTLMSGLYNQISRYSDKPVSFAIMRRIFSGLKTRMDNREQFENLIKMLDVRQIANRLSSLDFLYSIFAAAFMATDTEAELTAIFAEDVVRAHLSNYNIYNNAVRYQPISELKLVNTFKEWNEKQKEI